MMAIDHRSVGPDLEGPRLSRLQSVYQLLVRQFPELGKFCLAQGAVGMQGFERWLTHGLCLGRSRVLSPLAAVKLPTMVQLVVHADPDSNCTTGPHSYTNNS